MIVSDMIRAGQGNDVIKIWSQVAMKDNEKETTSKNLLADALSRLPSPSQVPDVSRRTAPDEQTPVITGDTEGRPTDYKSEGAENMPYFAPQGCLMLDWIDLSMNPIRRRDDLGIVWPFSRTGKPRRMKAGTVCGCSFARQAASASQRARRQATRPQGGATPPGCVPTDSIYTLAC